MEISYLDKLCNERGYSQIIYNNSIVAISLSICEIN